MQWRLFLSLICSITAASAASAGVFHVQQAADGRWWFVDPDGNAFYSTGINNLTPQGDYAPLLRKSPYAENIQKTYGSVADWAQVTADRMRLWGFNTLASWSDPAPFAQVTGRPFAYTPYVGCAQDFKTPGSVVPDYFSDAYVQHAEKAAELATQGRLGDSNILGYFLDNEMNWGHDYRSFSSLFVQYFGLAAAAPGKQALVAMLKERYATLDALNAAWKSDFAAWDAVAQATSLSKATRGTAAFRADESELLRRAARRYFDVCSNAVRLHDPLHLLLGVRVISTFGYPEVIEAAGATQDVVSINYYEYTKLASKFFGPILGDQAVVPVDNWLEKFYELSGKPLLISEFGYKAFVPEAPGFSPPIFPTLANQKSRATKIETYIQNTFNAPYVVGYHFFQWQDQPLTGRFDGEDSNWGLVSIHDEPYGEVTGLFQGFNAMIRAKSATAFSP